MPLPLGVKQAGEAKVGANPRASTKEASRASLSSTTSRGCALCRLFRRMSSGGFVNLIWPLLIT